MTVELDLTSSRLEKGTTLTVFQLTRQSATDRQTGLSLYLITVDEEDHALMALGGPDCTHFLSYGNE